MCPRRESFMKRMLSSGEKAKPLGVTKSLILLANSLAGYCPSGASGSRQAYRRVMTPFPNHGFVEALQL